jgi:hypothetical protein
MNDYTSNTQDNQVRDLNLEARMEKEFLIHGYQRRDFTPEQQQQLRAELIALDEGGCSVMNGFWSQDFTPLRNYDDPDNPPTPLFNVGERVWITEHISVNGVPGVGVVRKVEMEWIDLGEELNGYWEITYQLRNLRTSFTEDHVFATEVEALTAMASDFRKRVISQAGAMCRRMRALGMNITVRELIDSVGEFV